MREGGPQCTALVLQNPERFRFLVIVVGAYWPLQPCLLWGTSVEGDYVMQEATCHSRDAARWVLGSERQQSTRVGSASTRRAPLQMQCHLRRAGRHRELDRRERLQSAHRLPRDRVDRSAWTLPSGRQSGQLIHEYAP